jgi:hypothetical protein
VPGAVKERAAHSILGICPYPPPLAAWLGLGNLCQSSFSFSYHHHAHRAHAENALEGPLMTATIRNPQQVDCSSTSLPHYISCRCLVRFGFSPKDPNPEPDLGSVRAMSANPEPNRGSVHLGSMFEPTKDSHALEVDFLVNKPFIHHIRHVSRHHYDVQMRPYLSAESTSRLNLPRIESLQLRYLPQNLTSG